MIKLIATVTFFVFLCYIYQTQTPRVHLQRGVSFARPSWCPENEEDCSFHIKNKANESLRSYLERVHPEDPYLLSEQYALESNEPLDDKEYDEEFSKVFRMQFRHFLPHIQLAKRLGEPIGKYVKFDNERS